MLASTLLMIRVMVAMRYLYDIMMDEWPNEPYNLQAYWWYIKDWIWCARDSKPRAIHILCCFWLAVDKCEALSAISLHYVVVCQQYPLFRQTWGINPNSKIEGTRKNFHICALLITRCHFMSSIIHIKVKALRDYNSLHSGMQICIWWSC